MGGYERMGKGRAVSTYAKRQNRLIQPSAACRMKPLAPWHPRAPRPSAPAATRAAAFEQLTTMCRGEWMETHKGRKLPPALIPVHRGVS